MESVDRSTQMSGMKDTRRSDSIIVLKKMQKRRKPGTELLFVETFAAVRADVHKPTSLLPRVWHWFSLV